MNKMSAESKQLLPSIICSSGLSSLSLNSVINFKIYIHIYRDIYIEISIDIDIDRTYI